MIALDAGEAVDFLVGASGIGSAPAGDRAVAPQAPAADLPAAHREKAPSSRRLKVSVDLPLSLLEIGLRIGRGLVPGLQLVDWSEMRAALDASKSGLLVDVCDSEDGERVRIFVE